MKMDERNNLKQYLSTLLVKTGHSVKSVKNRNAV